MMARLLRIAAVALALVWLAEGAAAQSRSVDPDDLRLSVRVVKQTEDQTDAPFAREMVMVVITGIYRRHITREALEQPDLAGFNWTQLGPDSWREERIGGRKVKVLERRMALYPERAGTLTIGAFTHRLTLTDENDDWFEHEIRSEPLSIEVAPPPVPATDNWWFPVRRLEISDAWSNAPDRLEPGEGVLRVVRIEALGATPEMIPPMPELTSPSAMIFPHPEKRLVELTPEGPVTYAFWRWTLRPTNARSAIVEPMVLSYFDTTVREMRRVTISAQRVAYDAARLPPVPPPAAPVRLPGWPVFLLGSLVLVAGCGLAMWGRSAGLVGLYRRVPLLDPLVRRLRRAARAQDRAQTRRAARELLRRDGASGAERAALDRFDRAVFSGRTGGRDGTGENWADTVGFARAFLRLRARRGRIQT